MTTACPYLGVVLHLGFGFLFVGELDVGSWWLFTLLLLAWVAVWLPMAWFASHRPGFVPLLVVCADLAILMCFGALTDAAL